MPKHEPKFHNHLGLSFLIVAEFPDTDAGTSSANRYMTRHQDAGVLAAHDGRILIANSHDKGAGAAQLTCRRRRNARSPITASASAWRLIEELTQATVQERSVANSTSQPIRLMRPSTRAGSWPDMFDTEAVDAQGDAGTQYDLSDTGFEQWYSEDEAFDWER
ncbi:hypothetical protein F2S72_08690 [Pseudomonas syringae pv. actinidiae]|nr:hypothetical protein [Pseudomonas syringae pv. actinidiae]